MVHILLLPALILGLIAAHLALVVYHKHSQYPGPGRTDGNVVGYPVFPVYAAKAGGFFLIVFGVLTLMGATMQINPVWVFGPYNPAEITAGSQPDWYMGFVEGAIRIMPNWEWHIGSTTWSWNVFLPGIGVMTLFFGIMAIYPFVEAWVTGDKREHHVLDRPRNNPTRTAFGVAAMTCYAMLWIGGGNDLVATQFHVSLNAVTYFLRVAVFVAPVIAFLVTKRICIGLQRSDTDRMLHGAESGVLDRAPSGKYSERHRPISEDEAFALTQHEDLPRCCRWPRWMACRRKRSSPNSAGGEQLASTSWTRCAGLPGRRSKRQLSTICIPCISKATASIMRSKRSRGGRASLGQVSSSPAAPRSRQELRALLSHCSFHCLNPTSQHPQPAYTLDPHGLHTVQLRQSATTLCRLTAAD